MTDHAEGCPRWPICTCHVARQEMDEWREQRDRRCGACGRTHRNAPGDICDSCARIRGYPV